LEDNIKVDFKVIVSGIMDCIHLLQERDWGWNIMKTVMNLLGPLNAGNFL
jgi:hypothetical protein